MFVESGAEVHVPEKHSYRKEAMEKQEQVARKGNLVRRPHRKCYRSAHG